ncbi:MAG: Spy/CpxP family protein refolding chaperone [Flavobacterium stagni]
MKKVICFVLLLLGVSLTAQERPAGPPPNDGPPHENENPEKHLERMKKDLKLSDQQVSQLREHFKKRKAEREAFKPKDGERPQPSERKAHHEARIKADEEAMKKILTPEQLKQWKEHREDGMKKKQEKKAKKKEKRKEKKKEKKE